MRRGAIVVALLAMLLAGCGVGRGCRPVEPEPPTVTVSPAPATWTPTWTATPTLTGTGTARPTIGASGTPDGQNPGATASLTPTGSSTSVLVTATSTRANSPATREATATPELLGVHRVVAGETMWGIGLMWYAGEYLAWGVDVWGPICGANPEIGNCRLIYSGDVLRIPVRE